MRKMLNSSSFFHTILNQDVSFQPGTLENILQFMQDNPQTGLLMPKTVYPDGSMQYNCKYLPSPMDLIAKRFFPQCLKKRRMARFMMQEFDHEQILHVPYLCGCFMMFRKNALQHAGLFDERFFMYPEDIDITRRIYSAGFHTIYYPFAEIIHAHEQASYKNWNMLFIHILNMCRYFNKWGWVFDRERSEINKKIKQLNLSKIS
jgi:GT2 family glycosyltransferase